MSRRHTIGFELNDTAYETGVTYLGSPAIVGSPARTGSYALELTSQERIGYGVSGATEIYMGVGLYLNTIAQTYNVIEFWSTSADLFYIKVAIGGAIQAIRGSTVLATSVNTLTTGGWNYIEVYYYPDNSAGVCTVRVNGAEWLTCSGDTRNNDNIMAAVRLVNTTPIGVNVQFDDLVINDTDGSVNNSWTGQQKLYLAIPNASGDATDLTASAGNNWEAVNEAPPDTSSYVYSSTATEKDLYNVDDPLAGTETLGSVTVNIVAKLDSGSGNLATTIKAGTTEDDGADIALTENWTWYQQTWNVNPDDSAAWEPADIDALQIGVEIKA